MAKKVLFFDIETHGSEKRWDVAPKEFFRLGQYAWGRDGEIILTEDYDEVVAVIREADLVVAHNGHAFDLSVLFGLDSTEPLRMALHNKVFDTFVHAHLVAPAPTVFTDHDGHTHYDGHKPEKAMRWLSLANLTHQFGLPGKLGNLVELAKKYNPPKTLKRDLDFGLIPLDDPEFLEYARQDVVALRALATHLIDVMGPVTPYHWREQQIAAVNAQISRNGIKVDIDKAQARVDALAARREVIVTDLQKRYGLPTEGKSPWATKAGKEAIFAALAEYGLTPETVDWPKTATGNPSLGGKEIMSITEGTDAEELGTALAELKGQRSLAQLALDSMWSDGRVHPEITALQRSGRLSFTQPGLTVWTARGDNAVEKEYFTADAGNVFVEMDYSSADARAVAAVSGDTKFMERFEPGVDSHDLTGVIFWGKERYYADRDNLRPLAKAGGHSMAYRVGARKLASMTNSTVEEAQGFIDNYRRTYHKVARWQDEVTARGETGRITNDWGREMVIDVYTDPATGRKRSRAFTQAAALIGQSTTREMMMDTLLRFARAGEFWARSLRAVIHDALLLEVPEDGAEKYAEQAKSMMESTFTPKGLDGIPVEFPVGVGIGKNWLEAGH